MNRRIKEKLLAVMMAIAILISAAGTSAMAEEEQADLAVPAESVQGMLWQDSKEVSVSEEPIQPVIPEQPAKAPSPVELPIPEQKIENLIPEEKLGEAKTELQEVLPTPQAEIIITAPEDSRDLIEETEITGIPEITENPEPMQGQLSAPDFLVIPLNWLFPSDAEFFAEELEIEEEFLPFYLARVSRNMEDTESLKNVKFFGMKVSISNEKFQPLQGCYAQVICKIEGELFSQEDDLTVIMLQEDGTEERISPFEIVPYSEYDPERDQTVSGIELTFYTGRFDDFALVSLEEHVQQFFTDEVIASESDGGLPENEESEETNTEVLSENNEAPMISGDENVQGEIPDIPDENTDPLNEEAPMIIGDEEIQGETPDIPDENAEPLNEEGTPADEVKTQEEPAGTSEEENLQEEPAEIPEASSTVPIQTKTVRAIVYWMDSGYEKYRPASVVVSLYRENTDGEKKLVSVVSLPDDYKWYFTWEGLDSGAVYTVEETIPGGYTLTVAHEGDTFFLKNTKKAVIESPAAYSIYSTYGLYSPIAYYGYGTYLPQTGAMWWPVPVLAAAGIVFILIGLIGRRKRGARDE